MTLLPVATDFWSMRAEDWADPITHTVFLIWLT